jgi:phage portal protein BeeE
MSPIRTSLMCHLSSQAWSARSLDAADRVRVRGERG